ncbi:hypothetical protein [uncultured Jatrophihabitans sp.]|uniref:hypothetical protein n=1 Tax=uncultured Jatrophihabitans sp. TaxID=1610747 RepID=UPI0035CB8290
MARAGAGVVVGRRQYRLGDTWERLETFGRSYGSVRTDTTNANEGAYRVATAVEEFGRVDVLVYNAELDPALLERAGQFPAGHR